MAKATGKKRRETREEAVSKYGDIMPRVGLKRLRRAHKSERPGKPQISPRTCKPQKKWVCAHNEGAKTKVFDHAQLAARHDERWPGQPD